MLFLAKGGKPHERAAGRLQVDIFADDIDDVGGMANLFDKISKPAMVAALSHDEGTGMGCT
jgi:hypothetical protein